jgi:glycine betaine/proline transport system substrate-binding protein
MIFAVAIWGRSFAVASEVWPPSIGKERIIYVYPAWVGTTFVTQVGKMLLEQMGYKVELKLTDTGLAYAALASATGDVWSGGFLPGQQSYLNKYGDKLDLLSISFLPSPAGLLVPGYSSIRSIEDLKKPEVKAKLGGKIFGIDAGSGLMITTEKVIKEYGLDYELVTSSAAAMWAAFKSANSKGDVIAVTGWCPSALCGQFPVRFLDDPKGIYTEYRNFHVVRRGFRTDHPRAAAFLARYTFYVDQLSSAYRVIEDEKVKPEVAARQFIERNAELVYYWIGDLVPNFPKPVTLR